MTVTRGVALFLPFVLAATLAEHSGAVAAEARLTSIRSHGGGNAGLVIEATAPVPYIASRPDPLTLILDFRNVEADGMANAVTPGDASPISAVAIESADSRGAKLSRVRISLIAPVAHHVRSDRNTVVVDFDAPPASLPRPDSRAAGDASATGPLSARIETPAVDPIAALGLSNAPLAARQAQSPVGQAASPAVLQAPAAPAPAPSTAGQPPAPSGQTLQGGGGRQYTGNPVSLDFQQADLRAVLRVFSEISGLNIVIDPTVQGTVDVALRDVPWDQALDIILRANKLGYLVDGTIVRIAPLSVLAEEEAHAAEAGRRAVAVRRAASAHQDPELRAGRGAAGAADQERPVAARHGRRSIRGRTR